MIILLISLLLMLLCFVGILHAQDAEMISTLTGIGGGSGAVGGVAGVGSYLKSHHTGKAQENQQAEIDNLWGKVSNIENQNTAQDGERQTLAVHFEHLQKDVHEITGKLDNVQHTVQNMALDFARAVPSPYLQQHPPQSPPPQAPKL